MVTIVTVGDYFGMRWEHQRAEDGNTVLDEIRRIPRLAERRLAALSIADATTPPPSGMDAMKLTLTTKQALNHFDEAFIAIHAPGEEHSVGSSILRGILMPLVNVGRSGKGRVRIFGSVKEALVELEKSSAKAVAESRRANNLKSFLAQARNRRILADEDVRPYLQATASL